MFLLVSLRGSIVCLLAKPWNVSVESRTAENDLTGLKVAGRPEVAPLQREFNSSHPDSIVDRDRDVNRIYRQPHAALQRPVL